MSFVVSLRGRRFSHQENASHSAQNRVPRSRKTLEYKDCAVKFDGCDNSHGHHSHLGFIYFLYCNGSYNGLHDH